MLHKSKTVAHNFFDIFEARSRLFVARAAVMSHSMELRVGGKYRLGRKIGSGSFGDIYLGESALCALLPSVQELPLAHTLCFQSDGGLFAKSIFAVDKFCISAFCGIGGLQPSSLVQRRDVASWRQ